MFRNTHANRSNQACTFFPTFPSPSPPPTTMSAAAKGFKSTVQIYRDSLRLIKHIAGESPKGQQLRKIVGNEFKKNRDETDPEKVEALKFNAIRALSNYLVYESSMKDERIAKKIRDWEDSNR